MVSQVSSKKLSHGRRKIEIKKRDKIEGRRVTFSKRRTGLFDKAAELCVLCGANVAILTFSEGGKAFCFGNPDVDSVMEGYFTKRNPEEIIQHSKAYYARPIDDSARQSYMEASKEQLKWKNSAAPGDGEFAGFWWANDIPVDGMGKEELEFYRSALEKMKNIISVKMDD